MRKCSLTTFASYCLFFTCAGSNLFFIIIFPICSFSAVCTGTDQGTSKPYNSDRPGARDEYYQELKERYTNCTYIDGNLEISFLHEVEYDLSFLSSVREVTGYVLILLTYSRVIPLTNLRVIRGTKLYDVKYALYVALTFHTEDPSIATEEIRLTSLHGE